MGEVGSKLGGAAPGFKPGPPAFESGTQECNNYASIFCTIVAQK